MNKKIWIIEDDPDIRDVISFLLQEEGHEVRLFENATLFKAALTENNNPDLFLMDVMLPDGNGLDLCEQVVKKDDLLKDIPIIIMSAHIGLAKFKQVSSADDFIPKPFDINTLLEKVDKLLS
ncbi:MAG: response regulator [Pedobacter sp.]|uniref:response regulator n=1 Tax=Pedobacter sp. TaxID=1411316 RepID=UPI002807290C|nr:response regulator [Pedobacter sp.]MDQ8005402.1 response regulator [Pedobacter sp.]